MIYEKIAEYLDEKGISQTFVGKKTGIGDVKMSAILKGKRKLSASEYASICSVLGVSLDKFNDEQAV